MPIRDDFDADKNTGLLLKLQLDSKPMSLFNHMLIGSFECVDRDSVGLQFIFATTVDQVCPKYI